MTVQQHLKLSGAMAVAALPWLREQVWIPFAASVLIDVDHYAWHAVTHRTVSLRAATAYFDQADPPQVAQSRLLHHPVAIGGIAAAAATSRSRTLRLVVLGLLFHVTLDLVHAREMERLRRRLTARTGSTCQACHRRDGALQLHTIHLTGNPLDRYNPRFHAVLCPSCHKRAHGETVDP